MLPRVSTSCRANLSLQLFRQLSIRFSSLENQSFATQNPSCDAFATLAASIKSREDSGEGLDFCCDRSTDGHFLARQTPCSDRPVKLASFLVKQAPCGDGSVRLSSFQTGRKEVYDVVQQAPCNDCSAKVSASTTSRKEGHAGRKEGHGRFQQDTYVDDSLNLSASQTSRKEGHCSVGSAKVPESRTGKENVQSPALQTSCSYTAPGYGSVVRPPPETRRQEEVSSLVSETPCRDASPVLSEQSAHKTERNEGRSTVQHTCFTDGSALASTTEIHDELVPLSLFDGPSEVLHSSMEGSKPKAKQFVKIRQEGSKPKAKQFVKIRQRSKRKASNDVLLELRQKVELLESEQVLPSDAQLLIKKRAFVSASPEQVAAVLNVLKEFCASGEKACQVLAKNAGVLLHPVELLQQKLKVLADFQVGEEACLRLGTCSYMLTVKVETLQRTLTFLKEIGLSVESRNKIICQNPRILRLSIENSMQPTLDFLESTGMTRQRVLRLVERRPELFAMSVDNNLTVKHKYFQQLGFSAKEFSVAMRFLSQYPNEWILVQARFFKEQGFSDADVSLMIRKQPGILAKSSENIKTKLHYLIHEQNRDITEVVKFPACLGYSLEERIIPRFKFLKEKSLLRIYSLSTILAVKDSEFRQRFKVPESVKFR